MKKKSKITKNQDPIKIKVLNQMGKLKAYTSNEMTKTVIFNTLQLQIILHVKTKKNIILYT